MRQTLIQIPIDGPWSLGPLGEVPGFGFGIVLLVWAIAGGVWLYGNRRFISSLADAVFPAVVWISVATLIVLAPWISHWGANSIIAAANQTLVLNPRDVNSLVTRAQAELSERDFPDAVSDLKAAIAIDANSTSALDCLAWVEATAPNASARNGAAAIDHAKKACDLTASHHPLFLATLAAAQAEHGDLADAVATQKQALHRVTTFEGKLGVAEIQRMRAELQNFERGRPYRDHSTAMGKSLPIFGFGAMLFIGFMSGTWTASRRGMRIGYPPEMMWDIGIWVFFAGVIGCRIFYCIQYASKMFYVYEGGPLKSLPDIMITALNLPDGGLVYYGGIPTGLLAAAWIARRRGLNLLELGDVIIPSLFLGMAFGRIGCFLNGCCYGNQCDLPWGVHFPLGSVPDMAFVERGLLGVDQDWSFRLHPAQLYSSIDGFILFLLTHVYFSYRPRNGAVIALAALTYPLTRFAVESLRADEPGQFNTSLTISQWFSIAVFAIGIVFAIWLSRQPKLNSPPKVWAAHS